MIAIGNPNTRRTQSTSQGTYYMGRERSLLARLTLNGPGYDRDNYGKLEEHKTSLLFKNNGSRG